MANKLDEYRASTVGSEQTKFFLEVPDDLAQLQTKKYHQAFLRHEASNIEANPETETITDVTQKVQPTMLKSYAPVQPFGGLFLKDDPVCKYLQYLFDKRATGGAAQVKHLEVRTWDKNKAFETMVSIAIETIENEAGGFRRITGTFGYVGDTTEVKATIDNNTGIATVTPLEGGGGVGA